VKNGRRTEEVVFIYILIALVGVRIQHRLLKLHSCPRPYFLGRYEFIYVRGHLNSALDFHFHRGGFLNKPHQCTINSSPRASSFLRRRPSSSPCKVSSPQRLSANGLDVACLHHILSHWPSLSAAKRYLQPGSRPLKLSFNS
jgi:hypothetical protein